MGKIVRFPQKYRAKSEKSLTDTISEESETQNQLSFLFTTDHRPVQPRSMRYEQDTTFDIGADPSDNFDPRGKR